MTGLFDEIPVMKNERIVIRRITDADADAIAAMTADGLVYRFLPTFLYEKRFTDMHEMIRGLYGELFTSKESMILGIYLKEDMSFCGMAEYYGYKETLHKVCVGYRLCRHCWGKGIATEALSLLTRHVYNDTDTQIITASTMIENRASARVLEKNGFIMTASGVPEDWGYPEPTITDKWFG